MQLSRFCNNGNDVITRYDGRYRKPTGVPHDEPCKGQTMTTVDREKERNGWPKPSRIVIKAISAEAECRLAAYRQKNTQRKSHTIAIAVETTVT